MAGQTRIIDPKRIKRMCFIEGKGRVVSMVQAATGCDIAMNASFYSFSTLKPTFHLKSEGYTLANQSWKCYGLSWNSKYLATKHNLDYGMRLVMDDDHDTCISGYILLAPNAGINATLDKTIPSYSSKRGRTMLGVTKKGEVVVHVVGDGDKETLTAVQSRKKMYDLGCEYAIMLDGGGSSQACFEDGTRIYSSREVYNFLCIWLYTDEEYESIYGTKEETTPKPSTTKTFYRVQVGAFTVKANAEKLQAELKEKGYSDCYIQTAEVNGRTYQRVQVGSFSVRDNADKLMAELEQKGYDPFIQMVELPA